MTVTTAVDILNAGAKHIADRAAQRDTPEGERSMAKTVKAFNIIYNRDLTEEEGWQFMVLLKMSRGSQGDYNPDDAEDQTAYSALAGECKSKE